MEIYSHFKRGKAWHFWGFLQGQTSIFLPVQVDSHNRWHIESRNARLGKGRAEKILLNFSDLASGEDDLPEIFIFFLA